VRTLIKLGKVRALLLPIDAPTLIYDKVSKRGDEILATLVLYEFGWEVGSRVASSAFKKHFEPPEALEKVPELVKWIGLEAEKEGEEVVIRDAPGFSYGCPFERGLVAGIMSGLCRAPWDASARVEGTDCIIKPRVRGVSAEEVKDVGEGVRSRLQGEDIL